MTNNNTFAKLLIDNKVPKYTWSHIMQYAAERKDLDNIIPKAYLVPSMSQLYRSLPSPIYVVEHNQEKNLWSCTCPHHFFMIDKQGEKVKVTINKACKHVRSVSKKQGMFYPGRDLTLDIRVKILQDQIMNGKKNIRRINRILRIDPKLARITPMLIHLEGPRY